MLCGALPLRSEDLVCVLSCVTVKIKGPGFMMHYGYDQRTRCALWGASPLRSEDLCL